jgi:hypothetical protein
MSFSDQNKDPWVWVFTNFGLQKLCTFRPVQSTLKHTLASISDKSWVHVSIRGELIRVSLVRFIVQINCPHPSQAKNKRTIVVAQNDCV